MLSCSQSNEPLAGAVGHTWAAASTSGKTADSWAFIAISGGGTVRHWLPHALDHSRFFWSVNPSIDQYGLSGRVSVMRLVNDGADVLLIKTNKKNRGSD
jgi:hypothetical protein